MKSLLTSTIANQNKTIAGEEREKKKKQKTLPTCPILGKAGTVAIVCHLLGEEKELLMLKRTIRCAAVKYSQPSFLWWSSMEWDDIIDIVSIITHEYVHRRKKSDIYIYNYYNIFLRSPFNEILLRLEINIQRMWETTSKFSMFMQCSSALTNRNSGQTRSKGNRRFSSNCRSELGNKSKTKSKQIFSVIFFWECMLKLKG